MMGWYDGGLPWFAWLLMALVMLAFWGALLVAGMALFRSTRRDDVSSTSRRPMAQILLDERFARGDIDADEYVRRRDVLESGREVRRVRRPS